VSAAGPDARRAVDESLLQLGPLRVAARRRWTVGHVARRLLLGERLIPFFGHLDLAEHVTVCK